MNISQVTLSILRPDIKKIKSNRSSTRDITTLIILLFLTKNKSIKK